jgi:hypothetical protein
MKKIYWWVKTVEKSDLALLEDWLNKKCYFYFHSSTGNSYLVSKNNEYTFKDNSIHLNVYKLVNGRFCGLLSKDPWFYYFSENLVITDIRELTQKEYENYFK